jgi:hypothetical protein
MSRGHIPCPPKNEWQTVAVQKKNGFSDTTERLKVEGGWLYRNRIEYEARPGTVPTVVNVCFAANRR